MDSLEDATAADQQSNVVDLQVAVFLLEGIEKIPQQ